MFSFNTKYHYLELLYLALCSLLTSQLVSCIDDLDALQDHNEFDETQLPSLWWSAVTGSYRVLYQLEKAGLDELLTIEEWASHDKRQFRLDIIGASGSRTTFLTNGATREVFRYAPFVCKRLTEVSDELATIAQLFIGFKWDLHDEDADAVVAYGLGPLWLRAFKSSKKDVKYNRAKMNIGWGNKVETNNYEVDVDANLQVDSTQTNNSLTEEQTSGDKRLRVKFYFARTKGSSFVSMIDWLQSSKSSPDLAQGTNYPSRIVSSQKIARDPVRARARVIEVNHIIDESIFKLPVGYGCSRRQELDPSAQFEIGQVLLHQGAPNQATFEVVASKPVERGSIQLQTAWTNQQYSMKVLRMSKLRVASPGKTESYFVTLMQYREASEHVNRKEVKEVRQQPFGNINSDSARFLRPATDTKLRRIKRVWWAPDSDDGQATVYTIDQTTGECRVSHDDIGDQILLKFAPSDASDEDGDGSFQAAKMALSLNRISVLFDNFSGYHLIDEGESFGRGGPAQPNATNNKVSNPSNLKFRNRYYEKRVEDFKLNKFNEASPSSVGWTGPVSIVKQISTKAEYLGSQSNFDEANQGIKHKVASTLNLYNDFRLRLTILFFSKKLDKVVFKLVIDLLDKYDVVPSYAHEQMDISECFASENKEDIIIKYPLISSKLAQTLLDKRETIKMRLYENFFGRLGNFISPLQIQQLKPTFDVFNLRLQMTILNIPLSQTFQLEKNRKLAAVENLKPAEIGNALIETTSSSADNCGEHCEFYNCFKFAFDPIAKRCQIALDRMRVKEIESETYNLYSYFDRRLPIWSYGGVNQSDQTLKRWTEAVLYQNIDERPHLDAHSIVELMERLVEEVAVQVGGGGGKFESFAIPHAQESGYETNALVLRINLKPNLHYLHGKQPDEQSSNDNNDNNEEAEIVLWPSAIEHNIETMNEFSRELNDMDETTGSKKAILYKTNVVRQIGAGGKALRLQYNILLTDRTFVEHLDTSKRLSEITFEACEQHCELNDCRSFSYCFRDESCQISGQHNEKYIRSIVREASSVWQCAIYRLDFLSKFVPFGQTRPPRQSNNKLRRSQMALRPADCAGACMDEQGFQCQGFYFCRRPATKMAATQSFACHLIDWHVNKLSDEAARAEAIGQPMERDDLLSSNQDSSEPAKPQSEQQQECFFYSRSYLAQFDKYYGKRIELTDADREYGTATLKGSHNLESCANACLDVECLAFDACPASVDSQNMLGAGLQTCQLLLRSISKGHLKSERRCSTFVLSDKSHFNSKKLQLIQDGSSDDAAEAKPDEEAHLSRQKEGQRPESEEGSAGRDLSGDALELLEKFSELKEEARFTEEQDGVRASDWFGRIFSLALGCLFGVCFIYGWNEAYARDLLPSFGRLF